METDCMLLRVIDSRCREEVASYRPGRVQTRRPRWLRGCGALHCVYDCTWTHGHRLACHHMRVHTVGTRPWLTQSLGICVETVSSHWPHS